MSDPSVLFSIPIGSPPSVGPSTPDIRTAGSADVSFFRLDNVWLWAVIAVIVLGGLWWWNKSGSASDASYPQEEQEQQMQQPAAYPRDTMMY